MKVAVTVWNGRVAPVFDVAGNCIICETLAYGKPILSRTLVSLPVQSIHDKVTFLASIGICAVVCGALSHECELLVTTHNMDLFGFIAGDIEDVITAWTTKSLGIPEFSMPGGNCPRYRRRQRYCGGSGFRHRQ
ncbi:MAG: NifB/NifX family molybdenum-iron cluster-binding protein [Sphaerochaetaceae bacterium]